MKLTIHIDNKNIRLELKRGRSKVGERSWIDNNNLSEKLLPAIDEILATGRINPAEVAEMDVETDEPIGHTTPRIAETVARMWNFSIDEKGVKKNRG